MSGSVRASISKKNKYWISKNRYYELKYFCLQYPEWKKMYNSTDGYTRQSIAGGYSTDVSDPTYEAVEKRDLYFRNMKIVEQAAIESDSYLYGYLLMSVTTGLSFTNLKTKFNIPCGRDMYYDRYRRFFWLLDKSRK